MSPPFRIELESETPPLAQGKIVIGEFAERFEADLTYWQPEAYRAQWRAAVTAILQGAERSALIASMPDPAQANFIPLWPLYREGERVLVQHHIHFLAEHPAPFDPAQVGSVVPDRATESDDGDPISEWETSLDALRAFLAS